MSIPAQGAVGAETMTAGANDLREKVARLVNPTCFNARPEAYGIPSEDDPRWKQTLIYGGRLYAYERADEIIALFATPAQPAGAVPDSLREVLARACYGIHDEPDLNRRSVRISCLNNDEALAVRNWLLGLRGGISVHLVGQGAETDALADRFAAALKAKLRAAEAKYGWQNGWLKDDWQVECQHGLLRHVGKGDPLDVAAYAAFCWHHGWPTSSQRSTNFVTGAVEPTAAAIAAYTARYPDGTLSETSDNAIECWNRVAVAACLAGQSTGQGADLRKTLSLIRDFAGSSILVRNDALDHIYVVASKALDPNSPIPEPVGKPDSAPDSVREALEFYANPQNWRDTPSWDGDPDCITEKAIPVSKEEGRPCDCGDVARAALKALASHPAGQSETAELDPTLAYWIESETERLCNLYPAAAASIVEFREELVGLMEGDPAGQSAGSGADEIVSARLTAWRDGHGGVDIAFASGRRIAIALDAPHVGAPTAMLKARNARLGETAGLGDLPNRIFAFLMDGRVHEVSDLYHLMQPGEDHKKVWNAVSYLNRRGSIVKLKRGQYQIGREFFLGAPAPDSTRTGDEGTEDWRDDPSADDRWCAGVDYAQKQLCDVLGIDPDAVCWDAATETLDGDIQAVICGILAAWAGDDWQDKAARPAAPEAPAAIGDLGVLQRAAEAGQLRIKCHERFDGAHPDAGMVWPIEVELPCINGLSAWFTLGNIYSPDRAAQGYTDGALSDELARSFAAHIVRSLARPAAPEAQGAWSFDMEAAPRDGTPLLCIEYDEPEKVVDLHWFRDGGTASSWRGSFGQQRRPIAWCRLPAPPASSGQEG